MQIHGFLKHSIGITEGREVALSLQEFLWREELPHGHRAARRFILSERLEDLSIEVEEDSENAGMNLAPVMEDGIKRRKTLQSVQDETARILLFNNWEYAEPWRFDFQNSSFDSPKQKAADWEPLVDALEKIDNFVLRPNEASLKSRYPNVSLLDSTKESRNVYYFRRRLRIGSYFFPWFASLSRMLWSRSSTTIDSSRWSV